MVPNGSKGCAYGQVLNQKVTNLQQNFDTNFKKLDYQLTVINETQTKLFNHMSSRLPKGQVAIWCALIGVICTLLGVLGTFAMALKAA